MNMGVAGSSSPSTRFQGELIVCLPRLEKLSAKHAGWN
jgi:hypothetical protein